MLLELHIENLAVIQRADIGFRDGFNVLTGETGAGKSIVIDSLDAVLGGRTSREQVRSGADRASVTAVFSWGEPAESWCRENDIHAEDDTLIVMRRIGADGKSSCRVCGVPVSVAQLRELGALLVDIHGQNDGRQLMDEGRHRAYLDRYGDLEGELGAYRQAYDAYRDTLGEIGRLNMDQAEKERLTESLRHQIEELEGAELRAGEEAELSARRDLLRNAGKLTEALEGAFDFLYGDDDSAVTLASQAARCLERASGYDPALELAGKSIADAVILMEDAAEQLRDFKGSLDFSPEEYDQLEGRLSELKRLARKYGGGEAELIRRLEECKGRLSEIEFSQDALERLEEQLADRKREARRLAADLTEKRRAAAAGLEGRITSELTDLNMPSVRFEVEITPRTGAPGFDRNGGDEIRFLMSANAGEEPGRISRIASGGELSRIMLAMKNVFAEKDAVPTLVFDEIDSGVSGVAAQRVAEKIGSLSLRKQVLCVTHLPQIAAMADEHFVIEKSEQAGRAYTSVTGLNREGRKQELARLHGGENITLNTLISAQEQLEAAERFKRGGGDKGSKGSGKTAKIPAETTKEEEMRK